MEGSWKQYVYQQRKIFIFFFIKARVWGLSKGTPGCTLTGELEVHSPRWHCALAEAKVGTLGILGGWTLWGKSSSNRKKSSVYKILKICYISDSLFKNEIIMKVWFYIIMWFILIKLYTPLKE